MEWSWGTFAIAWVVNTILVLFSRGAKNTENVARFGAESDYRADPKGVVIGSIISGAIISAIITVVIGFF